MEVTNCKDINGNDILNININVDGTVVGVLEVDGVETSTKLSSECCINNGYSFDPMDAKCYWSTSCDDGNVYKIILNPVEDNGALFQVDNVEDTNCTLEVELDFLLKFTCTELEFSLKDIIENLTLDLSLEKMVVDPTLPIPNNLVSIVKQTIFYAPDAGIYLDNNTNTGLRLFGDCQSTVQNLVEDVTPNENITDNAFNSDWIKVKMVIDDPDVLSEVYNEKLKIVIISNELANFSILVDNVKLNKICEAVEPVGYLTDSCPNFNLKRVIDNKKSWVSNDTLVTRTFDLDRRETKYKIVDEDLSINTKEIDLLITPTQAIDNDIWKFVQENPCILDPQAPISGCTADTHNCVDMTALLSEPLEDIIDGQDFLNQLIDVKSRKTISTYPTIELLYYRYANSEAHCGVSSNLFGNEKIDGFVDLIGSYWTELIEQVVPATTIWGSSFQFTNTSLGDGDSKFKYRKSSLLLCNSMDITAPSPTSPDTVNPIHLNVGVTTMDITDTGYSGPPEYAPPIVTSNCSGVYVKQINDGSEFIGTINVIGGDGEPTVTGDTITINETISSDCDIYKVGDFNPLDFNNNDWDTPN